MFPQETEALCQQHGSLLDVYGKLKLVVKENFSECQFQNYACVTIHYVDIHGLQIETT